MHEKQQQTTFDSQILFWILPIHVLSSTWTEGKTDVMLNFLVLFYLCILFSVSKCACSTKIWWTLAWCTFNGSSAFESHTNSVSRRHWLTRLLFIQLTSNYVAEEFESYDPSNYRHRLEIRLNSEFDFQRLQKFIIERIGKKCRVFSK